MENTHKNSDVHFDSVLELVKTGSLIRFSALLYSEKLDKYYLRMRFSTELKTIVAYFSKRDTEQLTPDMVEKHLPKGYLQDFNLSCNFDEAGNKWFTLSSSKDDVPYVNASDMFTL